MYLLLACALFFLIEKSKLSFRNIKQMRFYNELWRISYLVLSSSVICEGWGDSVFLRDRAFHLWHCLHWEHKVVIKSRQKFNKVIIYWQCPSEWVLIIEPPHLILLGYCCTCLNRHGFQNSWVKVFNIHCVRKISL